MRSTRRIISAVIAAKKLPMPTASSFPDRHLYISAPSLAPVRGPDGQRLWSDEELRAAERRGFENAGGKWTGSSTKHPQGEYTAEDLKAALDKGMEHADQYIGAAIRGVWEKAHEEGKTEGKIEGAQEEKIISERNLREKDSACEFKIEQERKAGYAEGLAANPNFVKAKTEGQSEGERIGRESAEKELQKIKKDFEEKIQTAKIASVNEYRHNKKLSTRFKKWREDVFAEQAQKIAPVVREPAASRGVNPESVTLKFKNTLKKVIGEIPITHHEVKIHRPDLKHKPLHFCYNHTSNSSYRSHFDTAYVYPPTITKDSYDIDKIRLKDLLNSMILDAEICAEYRYDAGGYIKATPTPAAMTYPCIVLSLSLFFFSILVYTGQRKYDQYQSGETDEQYDERKLIERTCEELETTTPEDFGTLNFTLEEHQQLQKCKLGCLSAKSFHEEMRLEMYARRQSGFGDTTFFGKRELQGVYNDNDAKEAPFLVDVKKFQHSVFSRIQSEKETAERIAKVNKYYAVKSELRSSSA